MSDAILVRVPPSENHEFDAQVNRGALLVKQARHAEAEACFRRAAAIDPGRPEPHINLGTVLMAQGRLAEAEAACHRAIELSPTHPQAWFGLATALRHQGRMEQAIAAFRQALAVSPDYAEALLNLANALAEQGQTAEATACYRRCVELRPADAAMHSNLCYALQFDPDTSRQQVLDEHLRWAARHAEPLRSQIEPHRNDPSPDRRLRIGYVSPNFRKHVVAFFLEPILQNHDRGRLEIIGYSDVTRPDEMSRRVQGLCDIWRESYGLSDAQLARQIREDRIDVLVDLTLHMAYNRLLVLARKPAPVQITHLAYCGTSGMASFDACMADVHLMGRGCQQFFTERLMPLPSYWCYRPPDAAPRVSPAPSRTSGRITFGSMNNFSKVNQRVLELWGRLLAEVPESRLLLHVRGDADGNAALRSRLQRHGIQESRVELVGTTPLPQYFARYQQIDIALDPFPYGGGTTTLDALWMGVPVVTLEGQMPVGRGGVSILTHLGLTDLIASNPQEYLRIAARLAGDEDRRSQFRSNLRSMMLRSPLCDAAAYTRQLEDAWRGLWISWCTNQHRTV